LNQPGYLPKILSAVKWGDQKSENEFLNNVLKKWNKVEIGDILFMLSFKFCMNNIYSKSTIYPKTQEVRSFAVKKLDSLDDKSLNFILLQLVQALRYEEQSVRSELRNYLVDRCKEEIYLATSLYWFLNVESEEEASISTSMKASNHVINFYKDILKQFTNSLSPKIKEPIDSQIKLRDKMVIMAKDLNKQSVNTKERLKRIITCTSKDGSNEMYKLNPPLQLPIDPAIEISGIIPEKSLIFASAKMPVKYTCKVTPETQINVKDRDDPSQYDIMFKYDDDLRKDQLILQIISYIDTLLKSNGMDLEFTKYKVIFIIHSFTINF